jgi:uncharacterized protein (DUF488 family)
VTTIFTIGYKRKPLSTFIRQLQEAEVDAVVDIRLRNTSHLLGYAKQDTLAFLLREGFGIGYEHHPELAPTSEILDSFREDGDWSAYERQFLPLLADRRAEDVGEALLTRFPTLCLLCAEETTEECHRRLVAEYWAARLPGLHVQHL